MALFVEATGPRTGTPFVFLHGGGMDHAVWSAQARSFADARCLFVDLPGHGQSDAASFTVAGSVDAVAELIRRQAPEGRAHVVAHSLGGIVLLHLLAAAPEVVDHAVVASGNLRPAALYRALSSWPAAALLSVVGRLQGGGSSPAVLRGMYREVLSNLRIPDRLDRALAPTLLLAGDKEPGFLHRSNRDVAAVLPHARALVVEGAGHAHPFQNPERFDDLVRRWVTDAPLDEVAGVHEDPSR